MEPQPSSQLVPVGLAAIALLVAAAWVAAVARSSEPGRRFRFAALAAAGLALWMSAGWMLAARGILARFDSSPPPFLIFVALSVVGAVAAGRSRVGRRLSSELPLAALVGMQSFRLPLELVMHRAAREGVMPEQMTWTGNNFDIATGIGAALLAIWLGVGHPPRAWLWLWNVLGLALLANVVGVAIASLPPIHAFGTEPRFLNTWVAYPPYVWLPTILVPSALLGHLLITRRLLSSPR